jgi:hypothetical protein
VHFIDVERRNKDGAQFRRQVVQMDAQTLLILDFVRGSPKGSETVWTVSPPLKLQPGAAANSFVTTASPDGRVMAISYASTSQAASLHVRHGSERPFAGWVVVNNQPTPADALHIVNPTPASSSAILFRLSANSVASKWQVSIKPGSTADKWEVVLDGDVRIERLSRSGSTIAISSLPATKGQGAALQFSVSPAPDIAMGQAALKSTYQKAVDLYPPWRDLTFYRLRLTYALAILGLLVEAAWFTLTKLISITTSRQYMVAHAGFGAGWFAVGAWAFLLYLR